MHYAYVEGGVVKQVVTTDMDISELFHPSLEYTPCPEDVLEGYTWDGLSFTAPVPAPSQTLSTEILRLKAYSDPVYGSDRYFSEAAALQAEGFSATSVEVKEVKSKGLARKSEIKTLYPN